MQFPKDQELFKDVNANGTLDPGRLPGGQPTASQAFFQNIDQNRSSAISVFYKVSASSDDNTENETEHKPGFSDVQKAIDDHKAWLFASAADASYDQTKSGYIGEFPDGTVDIGTFGSEDDEWHVSFHVQSYLEHFQPLYKKTEDIQQLYKDAVTARKERRACLAGTLFLLLHMGIIAISALPFLPGMERYSWFGHGFDWVIVIAGILSLVIAWIFHNATANEWGVLGFIHMVCTLISLLMPVTGYDDPGTIVFAAQLTLIVSLISVIHYLYDGLGKFVRSRIADFKNWCDQEAVENYRRLRYAILWYRNIIGGDSTPFDPVQKEFLTICEKRSEF